MRKIVVGMFISLDGVIEGPGPSDDFQYAGWTMPYYSDEVGGYVGSRIMATDAMLLGRHTYQGFEAAFAPQSGGVADIMNNTRKYIVSTTLKTVDWQNSTLINTNIMDEITSIKQQPGQDISISGSGALVQSLMQHNLIDELSLLVYPVVLGTGKRLFPDGMAKADLTLIEAKPLSKGVVVLRYQPNTTGQ